ncbi:MAG: tetratricopeptide repeat protein [Saprospiraceae bacterium]
MNEQHIDTIHRYLSGSMDTAERTAFEAEIQANPALREEVELENTLLTGIERAGKEDVLHIVQSVHGKLLAEGFFDSSKAQAPPSLTIVHKQKFKAMKRFIAIAASLIVVSGAVWFMTHKDNPMDANALYSQYYDSKEDIQRAKDIIKTLELPGLTGVQLGEDSLKLALQAYESGKYDEALALLKGFAEMHPENDVAQYYIGIIHMSQGRYAKAIEVLTPISVSENSALKNDALWNLGLLYLKADNGLEDARDAFTKLSADSNYPYRKRAEAVLDQLLPQR